jgi:hypothetical protein
VTRVLGIGYSSLGMSVAREWGFPRLIIDSMRPLDFAELKDSGGTTAMRLIAQFSNALAACLTLPLEQQAPEIKKLTGQFSSVLELDENRVSALLENCHKELTQYSKLIQFDLDKSLYYQKISSSGDQQPEPHQQTLPGHELDIADSVEILVEQADLSSRSVDTALTNGIQDITDTLTSDFDLNQVLQMIMETIYRALAGSRVVFCLKDSKADCIRARFGYGEDIENFIRHFSLPLQNQSDVFHVALKNNVDIRIENTRDEKIRDRIPAWYHQNIAAHCFTLFPVVIRNKPIALIYIDSASAASIKITDSQLGLLKTLRNQAILALKSQG